MFLLDDVRAWLSGALHRLALAIAPTPDLLSHSVRTLRMEPATVWPAQFDIHTATKYYFAEPTDNLQPPRGSSDTSMEG